MWLGITSTVSSEEQMHEALTILKKQRKEFHVECKGAQGGMRQ